MTDQIIRMTLLKVEVKAWWKQLFCNHNFTVFVRNLYLSEKRKTKKTALYQCQRCGKPHLTAQQQRNQYSLNLIVPLIHKSK